MAKALKCCGKCPHIVRDLPLLCGKLKGTPYASVHVPLTSIPHWCPLSFTGGERR